MIFRKKEQNPEFSADVFTFTKEILNGKLHPEPFIFKLLSSCKGNFLRHYTRLMEKVFQQFHFRN